MAFTQFQFALFLIPVFALNWTVPAHRRWIVLLLASLGFYASWSLAFFPPLLLVTAASWATGLAVGVLPEQSRGRKAALTIGILLSMSPLLFYKYWNFLAQSVADTFRWADWGNAGAPLVHLAVPAGISFFTFKAVGYVVDVFRGKIPPERNIARYTTFVAFFPAVVSGPIDRAGTLVPQLASPPPFEYERARDGALLFAWGLFQKLVISDQLAVRVNRCWADPSGGSDGAFALAALFYTIQIYCDFAGYSNMAIGSAKLLGVDLAENFRNPYFATSLQDFWRRWHISLSTWLRDYVYIPLGGNRCSWFRHKFNLFATFVASGLWHGAGWTFLVWGAIHGAGVAFEAAVFPRRKDGRRSWRPPAWIMLPVTFAVVCLAWVFFRADSCGDAILVVRKVIRAFLSPVHAVREAASFAEFQSEDWLRTLVPLLLLFGHDFAVEKGWGARVRLPGIVRWLGYLVFIAFCVIHHLKWGVSSESFIYFKF